MGYMGYKDRIEREREEKKREREKHLVIPCGSGWFFFVCVRCLSLRFVDTQGSKVSCLDESLEREVTRGGRLRKRASERAALIPYFCLIVEIEEEKK